MNVLTIMGLTAMIVGATMIASVQVAQAMGPSPCRHETNPHEECAGRSALLLTPLAVGGALLGLVLGKASKDARGIKGDSK